MGRVIVIGDIHGTLRKLEGLIEKIVPTRDVKCQANFPLARN